MSMRILVTTQRQTSMISGKLFLNLTCRVCFAKLATKSILFVAKMPSKKEFLAQILSARSHEVTI